MPIIMTGGSYRVGSVAGTNIAAGTNYEPFGMTEDEYFNIHTQTLTNMTVIIEGTLDGVIWNDVTGTLFRDPTTGVPITALVSNDEYLADTYMTYKDLRIAYTRTNATNAVNFQWMIKKGGGR